MGWVVDYATDLSLAGREFWSPFASGLERTVPDVKGREG